MDRTPGCRLATPGGATWGRRCDGGTREGRSAGRPGPGPASPPWRCSSPATGTAACSGGGHAALDHRALQRAIGDRCADQVDERAGDGAATAEGACLQAGFDGDHDAALATADYNRSASARFGKQLDGLEAADATVVESLAAARSAVGGRAALWQSRVERLSSGEIRFDDPDAVVELIKSDDQGDATTWPARPASRSVDLSVQELGATAKR